MLLLLLLLFARWAAHQPAAMLGRNPRVRSGLLIAALLRHLSQLEHAVCTTSKRWQRLLFGLGARAVAVPGSSS
jgi:hypothetical protein